MIPCQGGQPKFLRPLLCAEYLTMTLPQPPLDSQNTMKPSPAQLPARIRVNIVATATSREHLARIEMLLVDAATDAALGLEAGGMVSSHQIWSERIEG